MSDELGRDRLYLAHIVEACDRIQSYLAGMTEDEFRMDMRTVDAVVRNFQVMGEAVKRLSATTRDRQRHVPWRDIARFRDVLIHRYDEVVPTEVWRIATQELPDAAEAVRAVAKDVL